jgi:hypothetical protein
MDGVDFSGLVARAVAGLDEVRACLLVSRDGLTLGAYPQGGEERAREAWSRLGAVGDPERGFLVMTDEVWVFARRGAYACIVVGTASAKAGLLLDRMEATLRAAEEARQQSGSAAPAPPAGRRSRMPLHREVKPEAAPEPDPAEEVLEEVARVLRVPEEATPEASVATPPVREAPLPPRDPPMGIPSEPAAPQPFAPPEPPAAPPDEPLPPAPEPSVEPEPLPAADPMPAQDPPAPDAPWSPEPPDTSEPAPAVDAAPPPESPARSEPAPVSETTPVIDPLPDREPDAELVPPPAAGSALAALSEPASSEPASSSEAEAPETAPEPPPAHEPPRYTPPADLLGQIGLGPLSEPSSERGSADRAADPEGPPTILPEGLKEEPGGDDTEVDPVALAREFAQLFDEPDAPGEY